jgi:tetratricopeptide (TPR) repeat protein
VQKLGKFLVLAFYCFISVSSLASLPSLASDIVQKGKKLQSEKRYEEALKLYKESLKANPSVGVYKEAGSLLGKLQKYASAERVLGKALTDFPGNTSLMNLLGLIKLRKGDKAGAISKWEEVLKLDGNNKFAKSWLTRTKKDASKAGTGQDYVDDSSSKSSTGVFKVSHELGKEEQAKLAAETYKEMVDLDKWEIDEFIRLHKRVIEKCPDTDQAEESCWRLSNLYVYAESPENYQGAIDVLEHLLTKYPNTPLLPDAKNRLIIAYRKTEQSDKVVELYEELFRLDPEPIDNKVFMVRALEFADALAKTGRTEDARGWYETVLEKAGNNNSLEAKVARKKLEKLQ